LPSIPALIACPGNQNILFEASSIGKERATAAIQSLMLRLLATQRPGKVRFTLIDPVGLGENVSAFMQLADHHTDLVGSKAWSESRHIDQELADLSEHMGTIIQKYLRGQYKTIEEYNQQAGEVAEPYRILVVMGFPVKFSQEAASRLVEIATNGPKCGVSTLVMMDSEQPLPYGFNLTDLERVSTVIAWDGQRFVWRDKDYENCQLQLDAPPPLGLLNHILQEVGKAANIASEVKVPFERVAPTRGQWWTNNTRDGIKIPLGRAGATKLQYLDLGKGTAQHVLVVGKTGSGKTTLLHILITNLALTYSPDELELYLVDFKTVGFTPYATYQLPHARVVATHSEREFGLSVLQGLNAELERRKNIFSKSGVQDISQYRTAQPGARMPRILLLVDEFQEFFTQDDRVAQDATLLLDRLVRQGRAFGIHVMLGSQTLAGAYTLARATIGQMAVRVALQCEEGDSRLVLSDDNPAARLLSRPGEAIYNAANGLVEGNNPFQCSWLPDEELDDYLDQVQQFAQQRRYVPSWRQIVFDGNKNADVTDNSALNDALQAPTWVTPQKVVPVWIGDPIAIKEPTAVQFRSQAGNNLLIVGQQEEVALGMLLTALFSLAAQYTPDTARFYVADFSPVDAPYVDLLPRVGQLLLHKTKVVKRRDLLPVITEIADEVEDRMEAEDGQRPPIYLFIYGLQRARDLRPEEDFSYSSFSNDAPAVPNPARRFSSILREGPELGVHTLTWCDTLTNLNRTLERGALREFEVRAVFQMSQEDSMTLVDSQAASKLGPYRALLFSEETGRVEKFRPYSLPTEEWLQQAAYQLRQKQLRV
jgi:DNA segregation ATPase FtsK/SpoIIIE, S-DNA-T family